MLSSIPLTTPEQGFVPLIIQSSLVDDATIHLKRCKLRAEPLIRSLFIGPGEGEYTCTLKALAAGREIIIYRTGAGGGGSIHAHLKP